MAYLLTVYALGCAVALVAGVVEQRRHHRHLRSIPRRIVVNGIRGKSSITRLCAGALRGGGLVTVAKTTGTAARFITPDGLEEPVYRKFGLANIVEQIGIVRRAAAYHPDALVIECMAVLPDLQEINERKLIQSTICVICNVREDHLSEMGPTLDGVARSLSRSMPIGGICVTAEQDRVHILRAEAARRRTTLIEVDPDSVSDDEIRRFPYIAFKENVAIALAVAELTGVDRDTALAGMIAARPDPGTVAVQTYQAGQRRISFANIFAANDPASSLMNIDLLTDRGLIGAPFNVVINCRPDRIERNGQMGELAGRAEPGADRPHRRADPQREGCRARRTRRSGGRPRWPARLHRAARRPGHRCGRRRHADRDRQHPWPRGDPARPPGRAAHRGGPHHPPPGLTDRPRHLRPQACPAPLRMAPPRRRAELARADLLTYSTDLSSAADAALIAARRRPQSALPRLLMRYETLAPQVATIALAIGLLFALACYLTTNLSPGGMITPGWLALTLAEDVAKVAVIVGVTALAYLGTRVLQRTVILYGKRLFAAVMMLSVLLSMTLFLIVQRDYPLLFTHQTLGFIVPGLIAYQLVRQPALVTLTATGTVTVASYGVLASGLLLGLVPAP